MGSFSDAETNSRDLVTETDDADDVANDSIPYNINAAILAYMANQHLYARLDADAALRTNLPDLLLFYNNNKYGNIGKMHDATMLMRMLADSNLLPVEQHLNYSIAGALLQSITNSSAAYVTLQRDVLQQQLQALRYEHNALSDSTWTWLAGIANNCPAAMGGGVYAARHLYATHSAGVLYNDNVSCNINNSYKKESDSDNEDDMIGTGYVTVFPNPAHSSVNISYGCTSSNDGLLDIYDMLGHKVLSKVLSISSHEAIVDVSNVPSGLYIYKVMFDGCGAYSGKLLIN
jgi:Secretion system C-terminal sorting domain